MKTIILTTLIIFFIVTEIFPQEKIQTLTTVEKDNIIEKISSLLIRFYITPEIGSKMAAQIQSQYKSGFYNIVDDPREFADLLTNEMYKIYHDKHLALFFGSDPDQTSNEEKILQRILNQYYRERNNYGVNRVEVLEGNIGYMNIRTTLYYEEVKRIIDASMQFLSKTDALIFDLRENGGGDPQYMAYLFGYLFDTPTRLSSLYFRDRDRTYDFLTAEKVTGQRKSDIPVFVLTSRNTFSAAESFAYDLQALKKATIVGEITKGGANPASSWVVYKDLRISIPYGKAINPVTGTNWEGYGVQPDVKVSADSALLIAHKIAKGLSEDRFRQEKDKIAKNLDKFNNDISSAAKQFEFNHISKGDSLVIRALDFAISNIQYTESQINNLGYDYMNQENLKMAIAIFKFNAAAFPNSSNAYDSLGEAYMKNGQADLAVTNYEQSLKLNAANTNARDMLNRLKGK